MESHQDEDVADTSGPSRYSYDDDRYQHHGHDHDDDDDELLTIGVATAATDEKLVGDADKMLECRSYQSRMHRPHHNIVVEMTMMTISCSFH